MTTGKAFCQAFPAVKVIGCAIDMMEHPIITRIISFMTIDQSVSWSYLSQVAYRSFSFANHHKLWSFLLFIVMCSVSVDPSHFRWIDLHHLPDSDSVSNAPNDSTISSSSVIPNVPSISNNSSVPANTIVSNVPKPSSMELGSSLSQSNVPLVPTSPPKIWDIGDIMISRCHLRYSTDVYIFLHFYIGSKECGDFW